METRISEEFRDILEPLGAQSAQFFLAASLYHAQKISFHRAAELSGLSFVDFKARLKEHFSTGYIVTEEGVKEDIDATDKLLLNS